MGRLGIILFENLSEEYPEVLGSILGALKAIVNVIGMNKGNLRAQRYGAVNTSCINLYIYFLN